MKQLLTILVFTCTCFASYSQQTAWFKGISLDSAKLISDSLVSMAASKYTFVKVLPAEKEGDYQVYRYIKQGTQSKPEYLNIAFQFYTDGRPAYFLKKIPDVSLTDIFPFWKKYINPAADLKDVASQYQVDYVMKDKAGTRIKKCILDRNNEVWQLWFN